jgi:hypothetical protein
LIYLQWLHFLLAWKIIHLIIAIIEVKVKVLDLCILRLDFRLPVIDVDCLCRQEPFKFQTSALRVKWGERLHVSFFSGWIESCFYVFVLWVQLLLFLLLFCSWKSFDAFMLRFLWNLIEPIQIFDRFLILK